MTEGSARGDGRRKTQVSSLFPPSHNRSRSLSTDRASLVDINRRLRDDWGRVR